MEPSFWAARWAEGRTAFHEGRPNPLLVQFAAKLGSGKRVLVPLCGKAEDLAWLAAQGHEVVGVELVEDAVKAFFVEHGLEPQVDTVGPFRRYRAPGLTLLSGDFFATTREVLGPVDALYDRAANIALPAHMRPDYVEHVRALLPDGSPGLLIAIEYPQAQMDGPPFALMEEEVRAAYRGATVELLTEVPADGRVGSVGGREKCYALTLHG